MVRCFSTAFSFRASTNDPCCLDAIRARGTHSIALPSGRDASPREILRDLGRDGCCCAHVGLTLGGSAAPNFRDTSAVQRPGTVRSECQRGIEVDNGFVVVPKT